MNENQTNQTDTNTYWQPAPSKLWGNFTFQSSLLVLFAFVILAFFIALVQDWFFLSTWLRQFGTLHGLMLEISHSGMLPVLVVLVPFTGGFIQLFFSRRTCFTRDWIVIIGAFLTIILTMMMYPAAIGEGITLHIPGLLSLGLSFYVDMLGFTMLMITTVLWFLVMIYAHEYMKRERSCNRFFFFMALTYSAVLGAVVAGDLLTIFLFFEVMTIASYMLVTHGQKEESYSAGYNYIFMGLIGGFAILVALVLIYYHTGTLSFIDTAADLAASGGSKYLIALLLIGGFGIKAGMAPVHLWLPRAHPVAPTPASALLSGIMIKIGAYGILRVMTSYFFPGPGQTGGDAWLSAHNIGAAVIWFGIITMSIGVFMALQQSHMKRMLAYHSVSQMGYIVMGIGVALYLGASGAMGYAGAIYHIINHALFKSLLFMVAGVVYFHTRENDMYKLGGLWRKLPLTATVCLIAALGISGMPLFNGFISKSILHHGIVEAYEYGHRSFFYAEVVFMIVSAGTVASFIKMFYYVFLRKLPERFQSIKSKFYCLDTAMAGVAVLILAIGLNPRFILDGFIIPQLNQMNYDPYFIESYVVPLRFFIGEELLTMAFVIGAGFMIFILGTKWHLFHLRLPGWFRIDYLLFWPVNALLKQACKHMEGAQCPLDEETMAKMAVKQNPDIGFLERFVIMANIFSRRYEATIIRSDALIYTWFITAVLIFTAIMSVL